MKLSQEELRTGIGKVDGRNRNDRLQEWEALVAGVGSWIAEVGCVDCRDCKSGRHRLAG